MSNALYQTRTVDDTCSCRRAPDSHRQLDVLFITSIISQALKANFDALSINILIVLRFLMSASENAACKILALAAGKLDKLYSYSAISRISVKVEDGALNNLGMQQIC